jgi:hypothetical protein
VTIDGMIDLGLAPFLSRTIRDAEQAGAAGVLLDINTFGGRVDAAVAMRDTLLNAPIRTIAFVNPRAISAGALIALATDTIVMASGGTIGAAMPVLAGAGQVQAADEKSVSYLRKEFGATAERRHRPAKFAEAMVDVDVEIPGVVAKGKLLTLTTSEALEHKVADLTADAVLSVLGHKQFLYPTRILSEGTRNILRAMETHGVRRFVCETSLGIGDSAGRMGLYYTLFVIPVILPFYYWNKTRQERIIAASNAEWVIVRPGVLTNGDKRGSLHHGRHVGSFLRTVRVSRADVADFMLNQTASDTYLRTAAGVC